MCIRNHQGGFRWQKGRCFRRNPARHSTVARDPIASVRAKNCFLLLKKTTVIPKTRIVKTLQTRLTIYRETKESSQPNPSIKLHIVHSVFRGRGSQEAVWVSTDFPSTRVNTSEVSSNNHRKKEKKKKNNPFLSENCCDCRKETKIHAPAAIKIALKTTQSRIKEF